MGTIMGRHTPGRLSPAEVNRLKRASVEREKLVPDGGNLYLQLKPGGGCSWIFRYERDGKERMLGLGPLHTFTLEEARERGRLTRQEIKNGQDPLENRKAEKAGAPWRPRATSHSRNAPRPVSTIIVQHGRAPYIVKTGSARCNATPIRSSESCRSHKLTLGWCCACSSRFG